MPNNVYAEQYYGFSALTVGTTNVSPFSAFASATNAVLTFEGSAVRYRMDGVSAHSASGHLVSAGFFLNLDGSNLIKGFNVICTNTTGIIMAAWGAK
jgi:hypothetical protein